MNQEAKTALDLRLARGEVSPEEYTKMLALISQVRVEPPSIPVVGPGGGTKKQRSENLIRVVIFALLAGAVGFFIYHYRKTDAEVQREIQRGHDIAWGHQADPSVRYIGDDGAVAGSDNYGRTLRLAPGTQVRLTGGTWMGNPAGPQKIYVVAQGELTGMQVALSDSDLRQQ